jgi:MFS family permease
MILLVQERPAPVTAKAKMDLSLKQFPKPYWNLLATGLFGIGNSSNSFLILQTKDIGASLEATILIYTGFNLVAALISYPAGVLSDRWGRRNILLVALLCRLPRLCNYSQHRSDSPAVCLLRIVSFRSVGKALATDFVPDRLRASGLGWYNSTVGLLGLAASVVAGLLWDHVGHAAVFLYGAAFAVIGSIALLELLPAEQIPRTA